MYHCTIIDRHVVKEEQQSQVHNVIKASSTHANGSTYMEIQTHPQKSMHLISHHRGNAGIIGHYSVGFLPVFFYMSDCTVCVCEIVNICINRMSNETHLQPSTVTTFQQFADELWNISAVNTDQELATGNELFLQPCCSLKSPCKLEQGDTPKRKKGITLCKCTHHW